MTKFPDDEQDLVNFLRQYHPKPPPVSPDLSQQILQQVESLPIQPLPRRSRLWLVPPIMAAGLVTALVSYRALVPPKPSEAELATLQNFIESSWQGTVCDPESDTWHFTDLISD